jgi:hypothetical protein
MGPLRQERGASQGQDLWEAPAIEETQETLDPFGLRDGVEAPGLDHAPVEQVEPERRAAPPSRRERRQGRDARQAGVELLHEGPEVLSQLGAEVGATPYHGSALGTQVENTRVPGRAPRATRRR